MEILLKWWITSVSFQPTETHHRQSLTFNAAGITLTMASKLAAVVLLAPTFLLPALITATICFWFGRLYMKAQLSVKREMSNAKSPILEVLGATMGGLGEFALARLFGYKRH